MGKKCIISKFSCLIDLLIYVMIGIIISLIIIIFAGQISRVDGSSMESGLEDHDILLVDKLSYRFEDPDRYDIIIFPVESDNNKNYIKRIIGLPGETVQIIDGVVFINGEELKEASTKQGYTEAGKASKKIVLGDDEYFVLGDNREVSIDSRYESVGNIKKSDIVGKASFRIFPFHSFGRLEYGSKY